MVVSIARGIVAGNAHLHVASDVRFAPRQRESGHGRAKDAVLPYDASSCVDSDGRPVISYWSRLSVFRAHHHRLLEPIGCLAPVQLGDAQYWGQQTPAGLAGIGLFGLRRSRSGSLPHHAAASTIYASFPPRPKR